MRTIFPIFLLAVILISCDPLSRQDFRKVPPGRSGIHFLNTLIENDTLNYTIFPYMYMGGGISVGDINNDGLDDIFFTGNLTSSKLYLNRGDMRFEDISERAGIEGSNQWFTGSTMADVNNDGWLDIYVCVSAKYQPSENLLYINNGDNTFSEKAGDYGIGDPASSVQATFFDYNNDGHQDLFVANYPIVLVTMGATYYHNKMQENNYLESGHLFRNNGNGSFTCVTREAGVQNFGMSIGVVAMDFNNDGWKDLYISNDFNVPDYFYQNNGDGTFTDIIRKSTFQTSIFGMGFDAADMNNDGLLDFYQIDMTPEEHLRAMVNVAPMSQETFDVSLEYGFHYQYMQNSLQLNNGVFNNIPVFSNISLFSGVAYTDWSWGGLFMDMDNDGFKDLFVSNGVLKDINNMDILSRPRGGNYFGEQQEYAPELFPSTPIKNYAFRNNGDLTFGNVTDSWGFRDETLTNGLSYGDFDNDGDLDLVLSNVNSVSAIYENRGAKQNHHHLKIRLNGPDTNRFGLGSVVTIKTGETIQKQELTLTRGYQSSVPPVIHFGTGPHKLIDRLTLTWPDGKKQFLEEVSTNQTIELDYSDAVEMKDSALPREYAFRDITTECNIDFIHREDSFRDFDFEMMLPHKNSQMGPGLTSGDVNSDGRDDFFAGNAAHSSGRMYIQTSEATFSEMPGPWITDSLLEDTGALLFDANGDSRPDLYVVSGGNDPRKPEEYYRDRLYLHTDTGFVIHKAALPQGLVQSGQCIKAADFDEDGDLDLFSGGRIIPGNYPFPANSYLLRNNGMPGAEVRFENITSEAAPGFTGLGLVTDAVWNDFDSDGDLDLVVVGEWMKIHFFENASGRFTDITEKMGFGESVGWWYSINVVDVDQDGDDDFVVGNLGLNHRYKSSKEEPFDIYANDFDLDGKQDIVMSRSENGRNVPLRGLNASGRQISAIRMRFESHEQFASSTIEEIYGQQMLDASLHYRVNTFASYWIENRGGGAFQMHMLPNRAQLSSINDLVEFSCTGNELAFIVAGNLYGSEVETPRNDASIGLVLHADSAGEINVIPPAESSLLIRGEVRAIEKIWLSTGEEAFLFAINNDSLKLIVKH